MLGKLASASTRHSEAVTLLPAEEGRSKKIKAWPRVLRWPVDYRKNRNILRFFIYLLLLLLMEPVTICSVKPSLGGIQ